MKNLIIDTIRKRRSSRTFETKEIPAEVLNQLKSRLQGPPLLPFKTHPKLHLLESTNLDLKKKQKIGTYGIIQGANNFIAGTINQDQDRLEDFGFLFEWAILNATELGLGTCWLGGTFSRSDIAKQLNLLKSEIIPCVSPIGFGKDQRSTIDSLVALMAKSSDRKKFEDIFLNIEEKTPYREILEMVRIAPSASNRQPWRIIYSTIENRYDFYLKRTPLYSKLTPVDLQRIDIGIAMCHFELAATELGQKGKWQVSEHKLLDSDLEYVTSWLTS